MTLTERISLLKDESGFSPHYEESLALLAILGIVAALIIPELKAKTFNFSLSKAVAGTIGAAKMLEGGIKAGENIQKPDDKKTATSESLETMESQV
jgi:2-iminoacetate synthase ThiH